MFTATYFEHWSVCLGKVDWYTEIRKSSFHIEKIFCCDFVKGDPFLYNVFMRIWEQFVGLTVIMVYHCSTTFVVKYFQKTKKKSVFLYRSSLISVYIT